LTSVNGSLLDPAAPLTWRLQVEQSGQHVLTMGIYFEVLHRWLGRVRCVQALTRSWTARRPHPQTGELVPAELPETVNALLDFENGAVGHCVFSGVNACGPSDHLALYGTRGTLTYEFNVDESRERLLGARRGETPLAEVPIPAPERGRWTVEADFIRAVRAAKSAAEPAHGGCSILPDLQAGLMYMTLIDAIHQSAETGKRVEVPAE
jgi:predicted dehydrogenase